MSEFLRRELLRPFEVLAVAALWSLAAPAVAQNAVVAQLPLPEGAPVGMAEIDLADLERHAHYLAADERQGRFTSTPGQLEAAQYVVDHLVALGFEPLGDETEEGGRSFLQSYPVAKTWLDPETTSLTFGEDVFTTGFAVLPPREIGEVVVSGKLIDCRAGAPGEVPESIGADEVPFVLLGSRDRRGLRIEAQFMQGFMEVGKAARIGKKLIDRGAKVVLVGSLHDNSGCGEMLNYTALLPGKPLLQYGNDAGMAAQLGGMKQDAPLVFLSRATTLRALAELGYEVSEDGALSMAAPPDGPRAVASISIRHDAGAHAVNVVGVLRGSDQELQQEALVLSAHMDHVGTRLDGDVFNGADDNASGTSALLEVAQAFAKGDRPRRSILVVVVSGEELGLWGSHWFVEHPTWPLDRVVADVNIDMIGRDAPLSGPDEISITPSYGHGKYSSIARGAAALAGRVGLGLTDGDQFYARSDHYNFATRGIPVVFFCDGEHEDYHQVTDTADKLDYNKIALVARLAYWTAFQVAMDDGRPAEIGPQPDWLPADKGR